MKYLIYLRVSTKKQDTRTQLDHSLRFIKQRDSTDFKYEVFTDELTSKKPLLVRPGGKALIEALRKGDMVIAMRVDRLARKSKQIHDFIDELDEKEVDILLVEQPGINNKIMLGIYAGMAEEEVKLLRLRIKEKLDSKRRRGERCSRFLPYGYALDPDKLIPIRVGDEMVLKPGILVPLAHEQDTLELMHRLSVEGNSYQEIADTLTDQGYKNREGKPFQKMSIYRILSRREHAMSEDQPLEAREPALFH